MKTKNTKAPTYHEVLSIEGIILPYQTYQHRTLLPVA